MQGRSLALLNGLNSPHFDDAFTLYIYIYLYVYPVGSATSPPFAYEHSSGEMLEVSSRSTSQTAKWGGNVFQSKNDLI